MGRPVGLLVDTVSIRVAAEGHRARLARGGGWTTHDDGRMTFETSDEVYTGEGETVADALRALADDLDGGE